MAKSACLTCVRPWVLSPALQKKKKLHEVFAKRANLILIFIWNTKDPLPNSQACLEKEKKIGGLNLSF
jgi:hypothetical protein